MFTIMGNALFGEQFADDYGTIASAFERCLFIMACALVSGAMTPLGAYFMVKAICVLLFVFDPHIQRVEITALAGQMLAVSVATLTCNALESVSFGIASERLTNRLRLRAMRALIYGDIGFYELGGNSAGDMAEFLGIAARLLPLP